MASQPDVTRLLIELQGGRREAFESLVSLLYDDLRMLARRHLRCQGNMITLHTSGLVHEAYLKLADLTRVGQVAHQRGDFREAERILREAITMHRPLLPNQKHRFAECLQELGEALVIFVETKGTDSRLARETRELLAALSP